RSPGSARPWRSGCGSAATFASTALSPSPLSARRPQRASAFSSWTRSLIATRSSSVNPFDFFPVAVVFLGDLCAPFFAGFIVFSFSNLRGSTHAACRAITELLVVQYAGHCRLQLGCRGLPTRDDDARCQEQP